MVNVKTSPSIFYNVSTLIHDPARDYYNLIKQATKRQYVKSRIEKDIFNDRFKKSFSTDLSGDEIVENLRWTLDNFGLKRHEFQKLFHENFIMSCLPKIYQKDWDDNYEHILKKYNITKLKQETLVVCPRRFGKTFSVAMFCAAVMWCVPNAEITIFSTGQRTAFKLMALCFRFLLKIPGFLDVLKVKNAEEIIIDRDKFHKKDFRFNRNGEKYELSATESKLNCLPGSVGVCIFFYQYYIFLLFFLLFFIIFYYFLLFFIIILNFVCINLFYSCSYHIIVWIGYG